MEDSSQFNLVLYNLSSGILIKYILFDINHKDINLLLIKLWLFWKRPVVEIWLKHISLISFLVGTLTLNLGREPWRPLYMVGHCQLVGLLAWKSSAFPIQEDCNYELYINSETLYLI